MRIDKRCKLEKVASRETSRPHLNCVYYYPEGYEGQAAKGPCAVAVDGHAMAIVPVLVDDGDTEGPISLEAMTLARKVVGKETHAAIAANGSVKAAGQTWAREAVAFPPIAHVIPAIVPDGPSFMLDVELLRRLLDAMGATGTAGHHPIATFYVAGKLDPVRVEYTDPDTDKIAVGVIMPCRA